MKRIAFFFNIIPKFPADKLDIIASPMGGWLMSMVDGLINYDLKNEFIIDIISPFNNTNELLLFKDECVNYFIIPEKNNKIYWQEYINNYYPDIIHINGTESNSTNSLFECNYSCKIIISLQGIISEISKYYYADLTFKEILSSITIKDIFRNSSLFSRRRKLLKKVTHEILKLNKADVIIGRTTWDYSFIQSINLNNKYRSCNENLREAFYDNTFWSVDHTNKYTIFCSQGAVPYKGLHKLLDALVIVKKYYPEVKVRIAGYNVINTNTLKDKLLLSGYGKFLRNLITKNNLWNNVDFIGMLSQEDIKKELLNTNVFIQTSSIENSPNSLGEAINTGTPIIASLVGGTDTYVTHYSNGLLYDFKDSIMLAHYIMLLFDNEQLAIELSENCKEKRDLFNKNNNTNTLINIYKDLLKN